MVPIPRGGATRLVPPCPPFNVGRNSTQVRPTFLQMPYTLAACCDIPGGGRPLNGRASKLVERVDVDAMAPHVAHRTQHASEHVGEGWHQPRHRDQVHRGGRVPRCVSASTAEYWCGVRKQYTDKQMHGSGPLQLAAVPSQSGDCENLSGSHCELFNLVPYCSY